MSLWASWCSEPEKMSRWQSSQRCHWWRSSGWTWPWSWYPCLDEPAIGENLSEIVNTNVLDAKDERVSSCGNTSDATGNQVLSVWRSVGADVLQQYKQEYCRMQSLVRDIVLIPVSTYTDLRSPTLLSFWFQAISCLLVLCMSCLWQTYNLWAPRHCAIQLPRNIRPRKSTALTMFASVRDVVRHGDRQCEAFQSWNKERRQSREVLTCLRTL